MRNVPLRVRIAVGAIALTTALGAAGCGEQDDDDPATAVHELQAAFDTRDLAALCARLTKPARKQAGSVAHGRPYRCPHDLKRAFDLIEQGSEWGGRPALGKVSGEGDRATATLAQKDGWRADVPLAKESGTWKLAGFFGAEPTEHDRIARTSRARPFPGGAGRPVTVVDNHDQPCGELSDARYPDVSGGCTLRVSDKKVPVRMLTPFGDFRFGNCALEYRMAVASDGRTWTYRWDFDGDSTNGCDDAYPCGSEQGALPWKGRLVSDGRRGYLHHVDMCLWTCIGVFAGDFVTRLVRHEKGWRVEPTDQGATGFKIDGPLAVTSRGLNIRS